MVHRHTHRQNTQPHKINKIVVFCLFVIFNVFTAFAEDLSSVLSSYIRGLPNTYNSSFMGSDTLFRPLLAHSCMWYTYARTSTNSVFKKIGKGWHSDSVFYNLNVLLIAYYHYKLYKAMCFIMTFSIHITYCDYIFRIESDIYLW